MTQDEQDLILSGGKPADLHKASYTEPYWCGGKPCISLGSSYMDGGHLVDERVTFNLESLRYLVALLEKLEADRAPELTAVRPNGGISPVFTQYGCQRIGEDGFHKVFKDAAILASVTPPYLETSTQTGLTGEIKYIGNQPQPWQVSDGVLRTYVEFSFDPNADLCNSPHKNMEPVGDIGFFEAGTDKLLLVASGFQMKPLPGCTMRFAFAMQLGSYFTLAPRSTP